MNSKLLPLSVLAGASLLGSPGVSRAALLAYEPFTNAPGTALIGSSDGFGFSGAWQNYSSSQGTATNTATGLSYTDGLNRQLVTHGGAGFFQGLTTANNSMQPIRVFDFSRGTNGADGTTTWISFLAVRQGPTVAGNNPYPRGANLPHDLNTGNVQKLAIGNSTGAATNTVGLIPLGNAGNLKPSRVEFSQTNFIVVRVDHVVGGNDNAYLFLNPTLGVEPGLAEAATNTLGGFDFSFDRLRVFAGGQDTANSRPYAELIMDEYRLGETYADVTPYAGAPEPAPLVFTNAQLDGASLVMHGAGGTAGGTYHLLASADLATPSTHWPAVATNTFDGSGNFSIAQAVQPGAKYFRLRTVPPPGPVSPSWLSQPVSLTVTQGQTAGFSVWADGTAPLAYQWYFNANTLLSGQTGTNLTLTNVQGTNAGSYSVRVSNAGGMITSTPAVLTVLTPPDITTPPQSQSVVESNNVMFTVVASGTAPLSYQWYYNTNTALANATNAGYTINNVTTNQAGAYSVRVSNNYGSATSAVAMLTVTPANEFINFSHVGFAANGVAITGGAAGPTVYVGSQAELQSYSDVNAPYTIIITNSFNLTSMDTHIRDNKTLIGSNHVVLSGGGLYVHTATNIIIRNLTIVGSSEDNIGLHFAKHVWIDHCTIVDASDGGMDITQESDNITVSWCHFYYSAPTLGHRLASLIGASDSDVGNYRVTYHHNWFGTNCQERLPSNRFGRVHAFNNYYNAPGNNYCVRTRLNAESRIENNWFENVRNPWEVYLTSGTPGKVFTSGNTLVNTTFVGNGSDIIIPPGTDPVFTPPYAYTPDAAATVPARVTGNAGADRGPFAP
jgi:pectate lyase